MHLTATIVRLIFQLTCSCKATLLMIDGGGVFTRIFGFECAHHESMALVTLWLRLGNREVAERAIALSPVRLGLARAPEHLHHLTILVLLIIRGTLSLRQVIADFLHEFLVLRIAWSEQIRLGSLLFHEVVLVFIDHRFDIGLYGDRALPRNS